MQLFHHYHHFNLHRILHSDFWLFELSVWMHVIGRALIAVFIPILLLTMGFDVQQVVLYYFVYCLFDVPLNFLAKYFILKVGARMTIVIGTVFSIIFFAILFNLSLELWWLMLPLAIFAALYDTFYWVGHIYFFMESSKKRKSTAKDTSLLAISRRLGGLLAPAIGAFILIFFQDKILIVVSIIILLISLIPIYFMNNTNNKPPKGISFKKFFSSWPRAKDYLVASIYGIHGSAEGVIWPMFIFVLFESIESVAIIPIIVSITSIIFTYFAGYIKRESRRGAMILGALLLGLLWIFRMFMQYDAFLFASVFLSGIFMILVQIPLNSNIYEKGEHIDSLSASTYRNASSMFGKMIFYGTLALVLNIFNVSFLAAAVSLFAIAMILSLIKPILTPQIEQKPQSV